MKRSSFFEKTVVLTLSNIVTGVLSFIFSIVLSREIGPKGMGLYQLVMPLYMLFLFVTGGGVTVSISKIAAEKKASGRLNEFYKTMRVTIAFEIIWSLIATAVLAIIAPFISSNILADKRTFLSVLAFCPALIIVSVSSVYKGAYYGLQRILEPALIDVIEKIVRVVLILPLVLLAKNFGIEYASAAAVLSLSLGELVSLILFLICYRVYVRKNPGHGPCDNSFQLIFNVLKLAIPLALNGILSTIFSTITAVLIPKRLQAAGIPYEEALSLFGKLQGMALTIAFFPAIVINAVNVMIIPSISEAITYRKDKIINHRMNVAVRIASVVAFSSAAIMIAIPYNLGEFFYKDPTVGELIRILAPGVPIVYIEMISFAILNGLGRQGNLLLNSIILSIVDVTLLYIFLPIPSLNIKAYGINFILSGILGIILNFIVIRRTFSYYLEIFSLIILPLLCSALVYILISYFLVAIGNTPLIILSSYLIFSLVYYPLYKITQSRK